MTIFICIVSVAALIGVAISAYNSRRNRRLYGSNTTKEQLESVEDSLTVFMAIDAMAEATSSDD